MEWMTLFQISPFFLPLGLKLVKSKKKVFLYSILDKCLMWASWAHVHPYPCYDASYMGANVLQRRPPKFPFIIDKDGPLTFLNWANGPIVMAVHYVFPFKLILLVKYLLCIRQLSIFLYIFQWLSIDPHDLL